ncbi:MAG TPA: hypothetical protein EYG88_00105 [Desulfocapsa sulfexigens]|nr:hypothetical protein [Desulfocapsa sulfexigens]
MSNEKPCPCGRDTSIDKCCAPIIENQDKAETAEQLMRSRYTAFTLANEDYIMESWAPETRPEEVDVDDDAIQWIGLEIEECEKGGVDDEDGSVTFTASFLSSGKLCHLHEKSRFVKHNGLWYYLDGETGSETKKVGRNELCPCGSGKKYKTCCRGKS